MKENCGGIFELQQNKSGHFSLASGNGHPAGGSLPVTVAGRFAGLPAPGLLCPQALTVADRHTKKPHAFA
ncbi:hypothetical protein ACM36D_001429 [Cronobacter sakazakii]|uniref:hypothetical protein n=1 Tax=Cronobacter sakazakii TaxID=28141 RepID=UPI003B8EAA11